MVYFCFAQQRGGAWGWLYVVGVDPLQGGMDEGALCHFVVLSALVFGDEAHADVGD